MPGELQGRELQGRAMQDVTAADADCRLDQMSEIRLTVHAWELTRSARLQVGGLAVSVCGGQC